MLFAGCVWWFTLLMSHYCVIEWNWEKCKLRQFYLFIYIFLSVHVFQKKGGFLGGKKLPKDIPKTQKQQQNSERKI